MSSCFVRWMLKFTEACFRFVFSRNLASAVPPFPKLGLTRLQTAGSAVLEDVGTIADSEHRDRWCKFCTTATVSCAGADWEMLARRPEAHDAGRGKYCVDEIERAQEATVPP